MIDRRSLLCAALAATSATVRAQAAAAPLESARILTGFPAGGTLDVVARRVADKLRGAYARTVIVENRAGAGGRLAVDELRRATPDGSTLLITPAAMITLYPHLYAKLPYGLEDVSAVSGATQVVFGLAIGPAVPASVRSLRDFIAWAKANPIHASYGSPGAGSPPHYVGALLEREAGLDLNHVPYRGTVPGVQDLLGGQIACFIGPIGDYLPHLASGRLRVLSTTGPKRSRFLPDVPTVGELGLKSLEQVEWYGFFLPGKAAPERIQRAQAALRAALNAPDMAEAMAPYGLELFPAGADELARAVRDEYKAWAPIVARVGFKPES